jgi:hypothetical protein
MLVFHFDNKAVATRLSEGFRFPVTTPWSVVMPESALTNPKQLYAEVARLACGRMKAEARHALN